MINIEVNIMKKILVVEDDNDIRNILKNYLVDAGYEVILAVDGVEGISKFNFDINLVLLDIMLPKIDGFGVCEVIRNQSQVPIIMLTALTDEENQIKGFEHQIDDYVVKPFSAKVLLYKIDAILRREVSAIESKICINYRDLVMDISGHHLYQNGNEIVLTQKEFEIFQLMLENQGRVFTREMLLDKLWGIDSSVEDRIIDSHMKNLRKKLVGMYITTIRGVGYRIDEEI